MQNGNHAGPTTVDALVVGAGFSGVAMLYRLRQLGLKSLVLESAADFGGVWYWNRYPGARVDSEWPYYQLNIPEVYSSWTFSERFPGHREIRSYFAHLDKTLDLRKDVVFNAHVYDCRWIESDGQWEVKAKMQKGDWQGQSESTSQPDQVVRCKYLILCTGLLHRRHYPDFPGLETYKGILHHTGFWPEDMSTKGKKVGIVGAGATAVQVVQEVAKECDHLTCFFRRPSMCLPMKQRKLNLDEQNEWKSYFPMLFTQGRLSQAGFPNERPTKKMQDDEVAAREHKWETGWNRGGFNYLQNNYANVVLDKDANKEVYAFWAKKVRERLSHDKKKELLAPLGEKQPYYFGTKRCPLEQDYYECMDRENVDIFDLNATPFKSFNEKGIELSDGTQLNFDMIVLATGFDSFSGSLTSMGLKNKEGVDIKQYWADGVKSYLGMAINGFPNAFMAYTPQAPTALSNGPTIIETQCDFIASLISSLHSKNIKSIQPTAAAQVEWQALIDMMNKHTLFPLTSSWWTGGNIPGKKAQMLTYPAGIMVSQPLSSVTPVFGSLGGNANSRQMYEAQCKETLGEFKGFDVEYQKTGEIKTEEPGEKIQADHVEQAIVNGEVKVGS